MSDVKAALDGASAVLTTNFSQDADLLELLRKQLWDQGLVVSELAKGGAENNNSAKFRDYFEYSEAIAKIPPHRALALFRGRSEKILQLALKMPSELENTNWSSDYGPCEHGIASHFGISDEGRPADELSLIHI